ncbi:MAG TPA: hypothetical protein VGN75_08685, partial [Kaistia sp.]|nr:hypothetical protein [Kaistia sp.]
HVAVKGIGQVEPAAAAHNQMKTLFDTHVRLDSRSGLRMRRPRPSRAEECNESLANPAERAPALPLENRESRRI